jgi:3-oxoacyl-[acyl-carrier protein] reductase
MTNALEGRNVLVTGAATGTGAAAVEVFAREGASVVATHHNTPPPAQLADKATWRRCDARIKADVDAMVGAAVGDLGGLDVLLHCAGLWAPSRPDSLSEDDLDSLLATNVKSTVFTNQAAFEHMKASGGAIINLGSSEGVSGNPIAASYSLTKAAVHGWTRAAARAWGRYRITVNSLAPAVETPGAERFRAFVGPEAVPIVEQQTAERIVIGNKLGDPVNDLGPALVFLASPGAHFITGQLLAVNGGAMMVGA